MSTRIKEVVLTCELVSWVSADKRVLVRLLTMKILEMGRVEIPYNTLFSDMLSCYGVNAKTVCVTKDFLAKRLE